MKKIRVGITIGDPSGIGPAITAKAVDKLKGLAKFVIIGDKWVFEKTKDQRPKTSRYQFVDLNNVPRTNFSFGKIKAEYGRASVEYLDKALELIAEKKIDCLVTCPVSKEAVNLSGIKFSGHTEYLAQYLGTHNLIAPLGEKNRQLSNVSPELPPELPELVMMLLNDKLKFSLVTRHIPLKEASHCLNKEKIRNTIRLTQEGLRQLFRIKSARIVVCALNPHASDNGLIGDEENRVIKPAVRELKQSLKSIAGPLPADLAIMQAAQKKYDCVIAMYHDQALIPLKLTGAGVYPRTNFSDRKFGCLIGAGVNLTLGLPFIRTSPLHGTAFDIAKTPQFADPNSLIAAIKIAIKCALNLRRD